jgi:hypothetical protein
MFTRLRRTPSVVQDVSAQPSLKTSKNLKKDEDSAFYNLQSSMTGSQNASGNVHQTKNINSMPNLGTRSPTPTLTDGLVTPEIAFRMCKKIAQLTKVVCLVHTRNSDNEARVSAIVFAYETLVKNVHIPPFKISRHIFDFSYLL